MFVGANCGIMDQFASCYGAAGHALLLDCRSLEFRKVAIPPNIRLVACNLMIKHELNQGAYNLRRLQCEEGVKKLAAVLPGVRALRDVTAAELKDQFVTRFTELARAFTHLLKNETDDTIFIFPVNEPSFVSWGGGDAGFLNPFAAGRDWDIKTQLIRAAIEGTEAIWDVSPTARIVQCDPAIHIVPAQDRPQDSDAVEKHRMFQFQALDMLTGRAAPELGGRPKYLDILGMNFYYNNEWIHNGGAIYTFSPQYRLLHKIIAEFYERYNCPIFLAETGIEDDSRASWLAYICAEVRWALNEGIPVEGICLYPILNHPGWLDERHCQNGLFQYADELGKRAIFQPLADELRFQQLRFPKSKTSLSEFSDVST